MKATKMAKVQDPVELDSKHYKVELENEYLRVLRIKYGSREKSVMHGHPAGLTVFLTNANVRFTFPDGRTEERSGKAGETLWMEAETHLPENLKAKPFEVLLVEIKSA